MLAKIATLTIFISLAALGAHAAPLSSTDPAATGLAPAQSSTGAQSAPSSGIAPAPAPAAATSPANPAPKPIIPKVTAPAPQPATSTTPAGQASSSQTPLPAPASNNTGVLAIAAAIILAILGALGIKLFVQSNQNNNKDDDNRCDNIKQLLEQKKKELQEMVQDWPAEKLKEMATKKVLDNLKINDGAAKVIEMGEDAKEKYDRLQETIEILQKRYDLCMLSLPQAGERSFKGVVIENSLIDKDILKNLEITKNYKADDLLLNEVLVNEKQIEKLGKYLIDGPWLMHFWQEGKDNAIIVFKDQQFKIKNSDKNTWQEAISYGKSKGMSERNLDFSISDEGR